MTEPKRTDPPPAVKKGGAAGPRLNLRKGLQAAILAAALIVVFTAPRTLDRRTFIFGAMVVVVSIDLVMLLRGDLDHTHFQSREWSFRINAVLLAIAVVLFALAYTQR